MNKVFVDADVILDLLAERIPHFHCSALLFTFAELKKLELYTSSLIFANTFLHSPQAAGKGKCKKSPEKASYSASHY